MYKMPSQKYFLDLVYYWVCHIFHLVEVSLLAGVVSIKIEAQLPAITAELLSATKEMKAKMAEPNQTERPLWTPIPMAKLLLYRVTHHRMVLFRVFILHKRIF